MTKLTYAEAVEQVADVFSILELEKKDKQALAVLRRAEKVMEVIEPDDGDDEFGFANAALVDAVVRYRRAALAYRASKEGEEKK